MLQNIDGRQFVVMGRPTRGFPPGRISLSDPQRTWCSIGMRDPILAQYYDPFSTGAPAYIGRIDVLASFASQRPDKRPAAAFDEAQLEKMARKEFNNQILAPGQRLLLDVKSVPILLVVQRISLVDLGDLGSEAANAQPVSDPRLRGIMTQKTSIRFSKDPKDGVEINSTREEATANAIFKEGFSLEDLGIGGLQTEFQTILRRAFNSRIISAELAKKMGIKHVKGILLYGPPGTGKTLIARQIGKMLNTREPKVINGPQILNKYVGQSEENVRKMFEDAQKEYDEKGDKSGLHLIIFDELDAVCKQRGSGAGGGTGVGDSVVNQLLSILDGVKPLNNIILIGMTNRKDMIDEALMRPGRLEVHLEINLPDEPGRLEILKIHTKELTVNNFLGKDVDLPVVAANTKNYSGAELTGVVNSTVARALARHIEYSKQPQFKKESTRVQVTQADFEHGLTEVKPAFGVDEGEISRVLKWPIVAYSSKVTEILNTGKSVAYTVQTNETIDHMSILLHGPLGAGKTALAAQIALDSGFPFISVINQDILSQKGSELARVAFINDVFERAHRTPHSVVILDDLFKMIEWSRQGSVYSNKILQTLTIRAESMPPPVS
jgi:vesicle-fusing ATPase